MQPDAADTGEPRGQRHVRVQPVLVEIVSAHPGPRLQRHDQGQAVGGRGRVVISPHRVLQSPVTRGRVKLYAVSLTSAMAWRHDFHPIDARAGSDAMTSLVASAVQFPAERAVLPEQPAGILRIPNQAYGPSSPGGGESDIG